MLYSNSCLSLAAAAAAMPHGTPTPRVPSPFSDATVSIDEVVFGSEDVRLKDQPPIVGQGFRDFTCHDSIPRKFAMLNLGDEADESAPIRGRDGPDVKEELTGNAARESCNRHCGESLLELSRLKLESLQRRVEMAVKRGESAQPLLLDLLAEARGLHSELRGILNLI